MSTGMVRLPMTARDFALVDAILDHIRRENWRLRTWPDRARQWERARALLGWWRSAW